MRSAAALRMSAWPTLARGLAAGAAAGVATGLAEAVLAVLRAQTPVGAGGIAAFALAAAGLYALPLALAGAAIAMALAVLRRALPVPRDVMSVPAAALVAAVIVPAFAAVVFRLGHHFATGYRNASLAALAMAVTTLVALVSTALVLPALVGAARRLRRPALAWGLAAAVVLFVVVPPLLAGPDQALRGPFGFLGILALDALDRAVPLLLLAGLVGSAGTSLSLRRAGTRTFAMLGALAVLLLPAGLAALALPHVRALSGTVAPLLPRIVGRVDRALDRDRDGYARALGGGDCDDHDARVNPAEPEVPDNGVDEDCDGEDLRLGPRGGPARAGAGAAPEPESGPASRPTLPADLSFVFITVDALNTDVGFMGFRQWPVSPNLDRLAARSTVYERTYALGTYTAQSMPPLMAGRYPSELRRTAAHEVRYFLDNTFLAELLKEQGFATAGAAPHFLFAPLFGWTQGFDRFRDPGSEGDAPPGSHVDLRHSSRLVANEAIRLLGDPERTRGRFFFWIHFLDPHKQYLDHAEHRFGGSNRARYAGEVAYTDEHIGRVLDALAASPLAARTVVVVTGDHGEAFGQHGNFFHGRETWDEIIRVPLVVHVPGLAPRRLARRVSHIDLFPTLLDLAGLPPRPDARGVSLLPELAGGTLPDRPILVEQPKNPYYRMRRVFIDDGDKLHHLVEERSFRLYDLDADPGEEHDLAGAQPERLGAVRRAYLEFLATHVTAVEPVEIAPPSQTRSDPGE
jgi:arylsulfatase A-like enzyme